MTRIPFENFNELQKVDGDDYIVPPVCANPWCDFAAAHNHHLVRRSFTIGATWWVEYLGYRIGNVVGLCFGCHNDITDNKARVEWSGARLYWHDSVHKARPLNPHPPLYAPKLGAAMLGDEEKEVEVAPAREPVPPHDHPDGGICPTCKRRVPKPKEKKEAARERRTWAVTVPKDERENGAEVLDELIASARDILHEHGIAYSLDKKAIYYVLSASLALFVQHGEAILSDG